MITIWQAFHYKIDTGMKRKRNKYCYSYTVSKEEIQETIQWTWFPHRTITLVDSHPFTSNELIIIIKESNNYHCEKLHVMQSREILDNVEKTTLPMSPSYNYRRANLLDATEVHGLQVHHRAHFQWTAIRGKWENIGKGEVWIFLSILRFYT